MRVVYVKSPIKDIFGDTDGLLFVKDNEHSINRIINFTCYKPQPLGKNFGVLSNCEEYQRLKHRLFLQAARITSMISRILENAEPWTDRITILNNGLYYLNICDNNRFVFEKVQASGIHKTMVRKSTEEPIYTFSTWHLRYNPDEVKFGRGKFLRITEEQYESIVSVLRDISDDVDKTFRKVEQEIHETWQ